jgi:hypothetical protein
LDLARGKIEGWRAYIDLEHDICYSPENHWSALTDGSRKYVFHARDGQEQLFDLEHDPHELNDLASDSAFETELRRWRSRLIDHLAIRGEPFVKDGKLALRPDRFLYSPNYPGCSCHPKA